MSNRPDSFDEQPGGPESPISLDRQARDTVAVLQLLAAWQIIQTVPPALDVCYRCGSLERADRACQVCVARRAAA